MLKPGDTIDIWVVDRALGQGGMGSVYRCHNREAKRILAAVKVLDARFGRQDIAKARFIREAEILFSLDHPHIVKVRNVRMDLELPYLEMEFIDGVNLETRMHEGPMSPAVALPLFRQVADALRYLHVRGIRHRDIKPSNLVVQPGGSIKLVDFGIATEADGATITQQGQTFGSASYAPPEWLDPAELDPVRWDIYAAGVVFWEVLTGVQAFPLTGAGNMHQQVFRLLTAKQNHPPLDPGPKAPRALRALIGEMTNPDWRARIADAGVVAARLAEVDVSDVDSAAAEARLSWLPVEVPTGERAGATMVPSDTAEPFADRRPRAGATISAMEAEGGPVAPLESGPGGARGAAAPTSSRPEPAPEAPQRPKGGAAPVAAPGGDAGRTSAESPSRRPADEKPGPTPEPADRAGTQRAGTLALGAVAGGAVVAALLGIGGAAWYFTRPTERDVEVTVAGAPSVTLAGRAPDERTGDTLRWRAVPLGQAVLRGVIGPKCVAGEESPAWCVETKADLEIPSGEGPFAYTFVVTPPPPRDLELRFTGLTGAPRARADDGAIVTGTAERAVLPAVSLGPHRVVVAVGTCTDADLGCGATCPAGCAGWSQEIEVPAGEGSFILTVPLQQPTAAVAPSAPKRPSAAVSVAAFAKWLASHPDWAAEPARAAGKADAGYLNGWDGVNPPAGGGAMVNVSWAAASAYCAGRGGLLGVDDGALKWTESPGQPWHEFRSADGKPAWRRSDGATSRAVKASESGAFIGFRCAK